MGTRYTVIIAEKPSLARAIEAALPRDPARKIVAARGHLLEPAEPDAYLPDDVPRTAKGRKVWRWSDLPIVPATWQRRPRPGAREALTSIGAALRDAARVIHAGDPDREGQLLIDEILEHFGYRGPVERVWLQSLTPDAIRAAFNKLRPNTEYQPLRASAEVRQKADWLVGMNLTRAWTLSTGGFLSVGRVQTPTLALVVRRDAEIERFVPHDFYEVHADLQAAGGAFTAKWTPASADGPGFDPEGRLIDRFLADRMAAQAQAAGKGAVTDYTAAKKSRPAPLPYSLSALQKVASARLGLGAQQVLDAAQALYEARLTTYPRTDCRYLSDDQIGEVRDAAERLALSFNVSERLTTAKHAAFNSKKITAHTAIIPTGEPARGLSDVQAAVYDLIARSAVALFLPPQEYQQINVVVDLAGERWTATGKRVTEPGWTVLYGGAADAADDAPAIPVLTEGEAVAVTGAQVAAKKTTPPARFSEGTLIDAMSHVHKYVTDPAARARLRETSGLGTEATRARILETLFSRGWIERKGKAVVSTDAGRAVVATLPDDLTDPVMTAQWEDALAEIAAGRGDARGFERRIVEHIQSSLAKVPAPAPRERSDVPTAECPVCHQQARRLESRKKPGVYFWACENRTHSLLSDDNGKPGAPFAERKPKPKRRARRRA